MQESGLYQLYQLFVSPFNRGPALIKQYGEMSKGFLAYLVLFIIGMCISYVIQFGFGGISAHPISSVRFAHPFLDTTAVVFTGNFIGLIIAVIQMSIVGWVMNKLFVMHECDSSFENVMMIIWFMTAYRFIGDFILPWLGYLVPINIVDYMQDAFWLWCAVLFVKVMNYQTGAEYLTVIGGVILGGITVVLLTALLGILLVFGIFF